MFMGPRPATLLRVEPFVVHGQQSWRLSYRLESGEPGEAILPPTAVHANPRAGDAVVLELLMGEAIAVRLADG